MFGFSSSFSNGCVSLNIPLNINLINFVTCNWFTAEICSVKMQVPSAAQNTIYSITIDSGSDLLITIRLFRIS